jgi:hypothetical protein
MTGRFSLALVAGALLASLSIVIGLPRPMSAQDLFPTPEGRLGGRMPLPTAEGVPSGSLPENTPVPSGHPLAGAWLLTFAEPDRAPAQVVLGDDGLVTFTDAAGNRGSGVWMPSGQQSGILALVAPAVDRSAGSPQITLLQGRIEVGAPGDATTLLCTYTVETVDGSETTAERAGPFTARGQRIDE